MREPVPDSEAVLFRFNRLIQELLRGVMNRNCFRRWEIELLLDIESCDLRNTNRRETLRRYGKAVQRHMENGATEPLKLSEYLARRKPRRKRGAVPETGNTVAGRARQAGLSSAAPTASSRG